MHACKLLFVGAPGAGKTTAIRCVSDIPPVCTDVRSSEQARTTTVAMDFGETTLGDGTRLGLYGVPGQRRFDFLWPVLAPGTIGVILLLDARDPDNGGWLDWLLSRCREHMPDAELLIGVTHSEIPGAAGLGALRPLVAARTVEVPVLALDPREAVQVQLMLRVMVARLESRAVLQ
jgi:signal recognition particle receptor subunit beta